MNVKICADCRKEKPIEDFQKRLYLTKAGTRVAYNPECKDCKYLRNVKWREEHPLLYQNQNEWSRRSPEDRAIYNMKRRKSL